MLLCLLQFTLMRLSKPWFSVGFSSLGRVNLNYSKVSLKINYQLTFNIESLKWNGYMDVYQAVIRSVQGRK